MNVTLNYTESLIETDSGAGLVWGRLKMENHRKPIRNALGTCQTHVGNMLEIFYKRVGNVLGARREPAGLTVRRSVLESAPAERSPSPCLRCFELSDLTQMQPNVVRL